MLGELLVRVFMLATISGAPCPGLPNAERACAIAPTAIYLPSGGGGVLTHELGHLIDYNVLTNSDRGHFLALMRIRRPWKDAPNSPHEQFAEAVELCSRSPRRPGLGGGYDYRPTLYQHRKVCRWMNRLSSPARP